MKGRFNADRHYLIIICLGIIVVPKFVVGNFIIPFMHIITDINILIVVGCGILIKFSIFALKFVLHFISFLMCIFALFKGRVFFQLLLNSLLQVCSWHLQ